MRIFMRMRRYSGLAESGDALLADMKKAPEGAFFAELRWAPKRPRGSECVANADCVAFVTGTTGDVACIADGVCRAIIVLDA